MGQTDPADLSQGTDIPLNRNVPSILSGIGHNRERAWIDVSPANLVE